MARPKSERRDAQVGLFQRARDRFRASGAMVPHSASEEIASVLEWAILNRLEGFSVGHEIPVGALSDELEVSRATVAKALEPLVVKGYLAARPKSPYVIIAVKPAFQDQRSLSARFISLTREIRSSQSLLLPLSFMEPGDFYRRLLYSELDRSTDALALAFPRQGSHKIAVLRRLRLAANGHTPWMIDLNFVCLPEDKLRRLDAALNEHLELPGPHAVSVNALLKQVGVPSVAHGKAEIEVGRIDDELRSQIELDFGSHGAACFKPPIEDAWVKWRYCVAAPIDPPTIIFSPSLINTAVASVFVSDFDLRLRHQ